MDEQQNQRINEAARQFAEAIRESYRTVGEQSEEARQRSTQLTQSFFESVVQELQNQSESNREAAQEIAEQSKRQQEAFQTLSQESANIYKDFLNSVFSYYQGNIERMRRGMER